MALGRLASGNVKGKEYQIKWLTNGDQPLEVVSDSEGRIWFVVGSDSGFEGLTTVYYTYIEYTLWITPPPTGGAGVSAATMAGVAGVGAVMAALGIGLLARANNLKREFDRR